MRKYVRSYIVALVLSDLAAMASQAGTILSVSGPSAGSYTIGLGIPIRPGVPNPSVEILAVSWSQTQSYSDVSISAVLNATQAGETVDAYLVQGTIPQPMANQVAHSTITLTGGNADYTLVSGLSLAAGTYSLVLNSFTSQPDTVGWVYTTSPTIVEDTGLTLPHALYSSANSSQPPYPPDITTFFPIDTIGNLQFAVVSVPEPSSLLLGGAATAAGLGLWVWRLRTALWSAVKFAGNWALPHTR